MKQRVIFKAEGRKIYFRLSDEDFDLFRKGRTRGELFLPDTPIWMERIFENGKMRNDVKDWQMEVSRMNVGAGDFFATLKIVDASIRKWPIRVGEPLKKHIVITTSLLNKILAI